MIRAVMNLGPNAGSIEFTPASADPDTGRGSRLSFVIPLAPHVEHASATDEPESASQRLRFGIPLAPHDQVPETADEEFTSVGDMVRNHPSRLLNGGRLSVSKRVSFGTTDSPQK